MKYKNTLEYSDAIAQIVKRNLDIISLCKREQREMTDEEKDEFEKNTDEEKELEAEEKALQEDLEKEKDTPSKDDEESEGEDDKNKENKRMSMNYSIIKEVRRALDDGTKSFTLHNRAATMTVTAPTSDNEGVQATDNGNIVQDEYQSIIDPLYPNSVLNQLGVRTYSGLVGDVKIPLIGKGTCGWAKEVAKAMKSDNAVTYVALKPHRIACYVDISNQLLMQDNIQFEEAVRRDIQKAVYDKIEETLFGYAAAVTDEKPAGLFYDQTLADATTYGKVCDNEASLEENNFTGEMKYVMSPKSKSFFRQTMKSSKNTEGILESGTIDGTTVLTTSNIPAKTYIYGSFDDIAVGFWQDMDVKIDDLTQAVYGVTRLIINCYVDFTTIRGNAFVFGTTDASLAGTKLA